MLGVGVCTHGRLMALDCDISGLRGRFRRNIRASDRFGVLASHLPEEFSWIYAAREFLSVLVSLTMDGPIFYNIFFHSAIYTPFSRPATSNHQKTSLRVSAVADPTRWLVPVRRLRSKIAKVVWGALC